MKKAFVLLFAALLACSFIFVSCGQSGNDSAVAKKDSPSDVMEKALKKLQDKDYKTVLLFIEGANEATEEELNGMANLVGMVYEANGGLKNYEILSEEISEDGQTATVKTKYVYGNGEEKEDTDKLVLTENGWMLQM